MTLSQARDGVALSVMVLMCVVLALCTHLWFAGPPTHAMFVFLLIIGWCFGTAGLLVFGWVAFAGKAS